MGSRLKRNPMSFPRVPSSRTRIVKGFLFWYSRRETDQVVPGSRQIPFLVTRSHTGGWVDLLRALGREGLSSVIGSVRIRAPGTPDSRPATGQTEYGGRTRDLRSLPGTPEVRDSCWVSV